LTLTLGRVLDRLGPPGLRQRVDQVRRLAEVRRAGDDDADGQLRALLADLAPEQLDQLIRAVALQFDVSNLAEDRHRLRVLRQRERTHRTRPRRESLADALCTLRDRGVDADTALRMLGELRIELVATAHPTEAKRRTIRRTLDRIRDDLAELDDADATPRQRRAALDGVAMDLACLWQTDTVRLTKPSVEAEVDRGLAVFDVLWEATPELTRQAHAAVEQVYGQQVDTPLTPVRFGTWIGGDRDGNPFVTPELTRQTLRRLRADAVRRHLRVCDELVNVLTMSQAEHEPSAKLTEALHEAEQQLGDRLPEPEHTRELYRRFLAVIRCRLEATLNQATADGPNDAVDPVAYATADQLLRDVQVVHDSLHVGGHRRLAEGPLRDWLAQVHVFGIHLARLDIREHSANLESAIDDLMTRLGQPGFADADEDRKQAMLAARPDPQQAAAIDAESLDETIGKTVALFDLLHRWSVDHGPAGLGELIVSMTHRPSDALTVVWLQRFAAARAGVPDSTPPHPIPGTPLFETIDDLKRGPQMLADLLDAPGYADWLKACGDEQVVMVGYSDSTKDGGPLPANWRLYTAQQGLAEVAQQRGVKLNVFHGRGGSLGRGGGPAARGILALPSEAVDGRLRITEQGEVLADRYALPELALRHLEQVVYATLLATAGHDEPPPPDWQDAMDAASGSALRQYQQLINDPGFVSYFGHATPIDIIETLPIGSRPSRRGGRASLDDLRAIPFTFAWTQTRHLLTAFFGIGDGLHAMPGGLDKARELYHAWPFFHGLIHNTELALIKADPTIIRAYARLAPDRDAADRISGAIVAEYQQTRDAVLNIVGKTSLVDDGGWLQQSVAHRNPYLDVLNLIQVELLGRRAARSDQPPPDDDPLQRPLRHSIQAIAAGLRTTG
jgi:phosphoenolpyruvate carboxylase